MEPPLSLALSMHSNPGVYALLLGSGVSRAAKVPTGWEVALDLIERVAVMQDAEVAGDPVAWYEGEIGEAPDYSKILAKLARHPDERQRLLRGYFEPSEEEREEGAKQPTAAHRAIASLCRREYIRVIVTTNFDRLLERALIAEGLQPTVISTADAVRGAPPLVHADLLIVKINGDYLDTRIRNTTGELERYPKPLERLLDRIFDEFGLVVCGWSARWDPALRAALERCKNQRYTTYWTGIEEPDESLQDLIRLRRAEFIRIQGSDKFFDELDEKVRALEEHSRPHPLSVESAVAALKRYLPEDRHLIRIHDLVTSETERVVRSVSTEAFPTSAQFSADELLRRVRAYEATSEILRGLFAVGCYWTSERHVRTWRASVERMATVSTGGNMWDSLQRYPGTLALYTGGVAAFAAENWTALRAILLVPRMRDTRREDVPALFKLHKWAVMTREAGLHLPEMRADRQIRNTPVSDWILKVIRPSLQSLLPDVRSYEETFDAFEYFLCLVHAHHHSDDWGPVGRFQWRWKHSHEQGPRSDWAAEVEAQGVEWAPLQAGFFDSDPERFKAVKKEIDEMVSRAHW